MYIGVYPVYLPQISVQSDRIDLCVGLDPDKVILSEAMCAELICDLCIERCTAPNRGSIENAM